MPIGFYLFAIDYINEFTLIAVIVFIPKEITYSSTYVSIWETILGIREILDEHNMFFFQHIRTKFVKATSSSIPPSRHNK